MVRDGKLKPGDRFGMVAFGGGATWGAVISDWDPSLAHPAHGRIEAKKQEAGAHRVKQFSDEYFDLARKHGRQLTQYLVFDEPVLVRVDDQAYLVEP